MSLPNGSRDFRGSTATSRIRMATGSQRRHPENRMTAPQPQSRPARPDPVLGEHAGARHSALMTGDRPRLRLKSLLADPVVAGLEEEVEPEANSGHLAISLTLHPCGAPRRRPPRAVAALYSATASQRCCALPWRALWWSG